ncbi:MAG TPA: APC family permease [Nitrospirota bacterium]|nr:APC family permease [Nitrospirota bacterium]
MANEQQPVTRGTLGITGLTMNAMALIAPGAFLWLTFQMQSLYGAPMAGISMWFGILFALLLCFATAISYAELSKLYPGPGSSYLYAEQAFLSKTHAYKFARLAKFVTGWASHLYYWVYPGVMVGVTAILGGFLLNQFWPDTFSGTYNSPLFMYLFCIVFALGVAYIAYRGVTGTTAVNVVINIIQISALLVFSVIAIGYRVQHPQGSTGFHLSNGIAVNYQVAQEPQKDEKGNPVPVLDDKGKPTMDKEGKPVYQMQDSQDKDGNPVGADKDGKPVTDPKLAAPFTVDYSEGAITKDDKGAETFNYHKDALSVVHPHGFNFIFIQAAIAILILVGFESVTAMGEEAKRPKKDIPRAVLLSLAIQGAFCYLIEYFAANYMLHNGYTMPNAGASGAPLGDLMVIAGTWLFGSYAAGKAFMLVQAFTVFLALIGTTLSCLSTGARVTYAMGRDEEVPSHFGLLHGKTASPHRAIWTLAVISAIIGIATVLVYLGGQATAPAALDKHNFWYSFGIFSPEMYTKLPNTLVIMTLISNFGTFMLYMITCGIAMVAFKEHHSFNGFKHVVVPVLGLLANLVIMLFYLIGPFTVAGMSWKEPYIALGFCGLWGIYGAFYFLKSSKAKGKEVLLSSKPAL